MFSSVSVEVVDDGGREGKKLFVYDVYVSFQQTLLMQLSIKTQQLAYINILSNPVPFCLYILDRLDYSICIKEFRLIIPTSPSPKSCRLTSTMYLAFLLMLSTHLALVVRCYNCLPLCHEIARTFQGAANSLK